MSFQSYLFSSSFIKSISKFGPCSNIYISNIPDEILQNKLKLCKFLSEQNIQFATSNKLDYFNNVKNILKYIESNITYSFTSNNEQLESNKIIDVSSLDTCGSNSYQDTLSIFYSYSGIKSVFSNQIIKIFERTHSEIRLKSLTLDKLLLYLTSYIRSLKTLNIEPTEQLKSNLGKIERLHQLVKNVDYAIEIEYKKVLSAFNVFNSIYYNIHSSGYMCVSDTFNENKNLVYNMLVNTFSALYIAILTVIMFIILTIMFCLKILGYKNNFLELRSIQIGTKSSKIVSNMS